MSIALRLVFAICCVDLVRVLPRARMRGIEIGCQDTLERVAVQWLAINAQYGLKYSCVWHTRTVIVGIGDVYTVCRMFVKSSISC